MLPDLTLFVFWLFGLGLLLAVWPVGRVLFTECFAHPRQTSTISINCENEITVER